MGARFVRSHELRVQLPLERAIELFTPAGERLWVEGWDPQFPAGESDSPGTVFVTAQAGLETFWTVLEREPDRVRYSRVTPGHTAGTVSVECRAVGESSTVASVTYDLTALTAAGEEHIGDLAEGFAQYIGAWEAMIGEALAHGRIQP